MTTIAQQHSLVVDARRCFRLLQAVPPGGEVYLVKSVIHNWDDARSVQILQNCRAAMGEHARLVLAERVIPGGNTPGAGTVFDLNMLGVRGGQERTAAE